MAEKDLDKEYQKQIEKSIKMFDVAKPGESRPSSTARPIIVGHKAPIVTDPMVAPSDEAAPIPKKKKTIKKVATKPKPKIKKVKIAAHPDEPTEPTSEEPKPVEQTESVEAPAEEHQASVETPESASKPEPEDKSDAAPAPEKPEVKEPKSDAVVDAIVGQIADKKQEKEDLEDTTVYLEEVQKLIDSKQYHLPITTEEQRRARNLIWGVLFIVVIAAVSAFFFGPGRQEVESLVGKKL